MLIERSAAGNDYFHPYATANGQAGYYVTGSVTKIFSGHKLSIIPEDSYSIATVVFSTPASGSHAHHIAEQTWTNGSTHKDSTTQATITPTDGTKTLSFIADQSISITTVRINYTNSTYTEWDLTTASYSYCGDDFERYEDSSYTAASMAWFSSNSPAVISRDFFEITSNLESELLSTSLLSPGHKLTFAIQVTCTRVVSTGDFYLEKYTSTRWLNRKKLIDSSTDSGYPISIDEAINIYSSINTSGWYFGASVDYFSDFSDTINPSSRSTDSGGNVQTNIFDCDIPAQTNPYVRKNLGHTEVLDDATVYFFFTVEFSDEPSTFYSEYDDIGGTALTSAAADYVLAASGTYDSSNKYYVCSNGVYTRSQPANESAFEAGTYYVASDRYFVPLRTRAGTSNCYAGLSFEINRINLELV